MWLHMELLGFLKCKRRTDRQWKDVQVTKEAYGEIARLTGAKSGRRKYKNELHMVREVSEDKKRFCRYVG